MSRNEFVEIFTPYIEFIRLKSTVQPILQQRLLYCNSGKQNFPQKEVTRWKRVHSAFKLLSYQGTNILYLEKRKYQPAKRALSTEEIFDTLEDYTK